MMHHPTKTMKMTTMLSACFHLHEQPPRRRRRRKKEKKKKKEKTTRRRTKWSAGHP